MIVEVSPEIYSRLVIAAGLGALVPVVFFVYVMIRVWIKDTFDR